MITCYCLSPETRPFANGAALPQFTDFTVEASGNGFIATGRGLTVAAMAVDAPYPDEAPFRACEGNLFWPKAKETVLTHRSHIALAAHHPGEGWDARRAEVIALSEIAAALCDAAKVSALYCPNGVCVAPPTRIYEALRAARAGKWLDWTPEPFVSIRCVDQRAAPGGKSDATFLSAGAAALFGHEVAVRMTGRAGVPHAVTLFAIRHLMANGPVFQAGDEVPVPGGPVLTISEETEGPEKILLFRASETSREPASKPNPRPAPKKSPRSKPRIWLNEWNSSTKFVERVDWESECGLERGKEIANLQDRYIWGNLRDLSELPTHGYCEKPGKRNLPDVFRSARLLFVSGKAKAVFEDFDLGASSFSPFELYYKDRKTKPDGEFFIFNLVEKKAGVVLEEPMVKTRRRSDGVVFHYLNTMGLTKDYVRMHSNALEGADIWLDSRISPRVIFYSDRLYRACRAAKLKRMTFVRAVVADG